LIKTFQLDNSPFIIGLTGHPDLEPEQFPLLVDAVVSFLVEIKQHLPDTQVRVMLDARNAVSLAIARAAVALDISVDALVDAVDSGANAMKDLLDHAGVHWIEGLSAISCDAARDGQPNAVRYPYSVQQPVARAVGWEIIECA
jgi:hypothetical protein